MTLLLLAVCAAIFVIAVLYSSVGHAGASGYIAVLTLFSFGPRVIKPTVLLLNILVAIIATYQFCRAGHFSWRLFWPFAVLSVPSAFLGGYLLLPAHTFKLLVGLVLLISAMRLCWAPLLLFFRWAKTKPAAATSAVFILVNSASGLLGYFSNQQPFPPLAWSLAVAAVLGGTIGSLMGSRHLPSRAIYISLACVLTIAGLKLIFT